MRCANTGKWSRDRYKNLLFQKSEEIILSGFSKGIVTIACSTLFNKTKLLTIPWITINNYK